jgi:hypothetical protein
MSNATTTYAPSPAEFAAIQKQEREQIARQKAAGPNVVINGGGGGSISYHDGETQVRSWSGAPQTASARDPLKPGMVRVKGTSSVTTRAAAIAAGLEIVEEGEDPSPRAGRPRPDQTATGQTEGQPDSRDRDSETDQPGLDLDETQSAAVGEAHKALSKAIEAHGSKLVESLQQDVAVSGEVPEVLPEGVTAAHVQAVVDGYTAQANSILRETGASVETLQGMLSDQELGAARVATFRGDDAQLQELGREATARLARLPSRDPALFAELTAELPEGVSVSQDGHVWWLNLPDDRRMPWSEAVKAGVVKF